jgi:putative transposase
MFVAQKFLNNMVKEYGKLPVSTDGGGTWYPLQACKFLKLKHHLHSRYEKSNIERIIQYIKDRVEDFDDYFPYIKDKCNLQHVINWFNAFTYYYNNEIIP